MVGSRGSVIGMARMRSPTDTASGVMPGGRTIERTSHCSAGSADIVIFPTARTGPARMSEGRPQNIVGAAKTSAKIATRHLCYICGRTMLPHTAYPAGGRILRLDTMEDEFERGLKFPIARHCPRLPRTLPDLSVVTGPFPERHAAWSRQDLRYRSTRSDRTPVSGIDGIMRDKANCQTMTGDARPARWRAAAHKR